MGGRTDGARKKQYLYALALIRELVVVDFKVKYQSSALGYLWSLLRPLFLFTITYIFFGIFIGTGGGIAHFPAYLMLGMVLWTYFAEVTSQGVTSVVGQAGILRKMHFPKYVIPIAVSVSSTINLLFNLVVVAIFMAVGGADVGWRSLLIIPLILELALLAVGLSFFLSALYVKFRDVSYIWEIALQTGVYITPVIYLIDFVYKKSLLVSAILMSNPIAQVIQDARYVLITRHTMTTNNIFSTGWYRLVPICFDLALAAASIWYYKKQAPMFAETV